MILIVLWEQWYKNLKEFLKIQINTNKSPKAMFERLTSKNLQDLHFALE